MPLRYLSAILFATVFLAVSACGDERGPALDAPQALALAQDGKLVLIDIRRPEEWRQTGVASGALRINMAHPRGAAGFVSQVEAELGGDRDKPIGLICRTGNRTTRMQQALREAGFTQVYNIREGMAGSSAGPGWIARGLPVEPCRNC
ncbi:MAG: rhodanese-like domain-containing protein [Gammaproteobacteria bacterium]